MEPSKEHIRHSLLFCFNLKKSAAETYKMFCQAYGENIISISMCKNWFRQFKSGDFDVSDKECPRRPQILVDNELQKLLDEDSTQSTGQLAVQLGVDFSQFLVV